MIKGPGPGWCPLRCLNGSEPGLSHLVAVIIKLGSRGRERSRPGQSAEALAEARWKSGSRGDFQRSPSAQAMAPELWALIHGAFGVCGPSKSVWSSGFQTSVTPCACLKLQAPRPRPGKFKVSRPGFEPGSGVCVMNKLLGTPKLTHSAGTDLVRRRHFGKG